jgi:glycosyltransferase involved in cell wall biosynthesis
MHINIVTVNSGWILQKIAERTAINNVVEGVTFSVSHQANPNTINYYVDLQNCYNKQKTKLDVAYFTHADRHSEEWLRNLMNQTGGFQLNGITSMNRRYTEMLERIGYPKDRLATITPGQTREQFPLRNIKIGIVSRGGYEGYGQFFIERLFNTYDCKNLEFKFLGSGWENLVPISKARNIKMEMYADSDYSIYPSFYQNIDYLLIPGLWTAGPMSMQESLSSGTPIIAADVGFVNYEFKADFVFQPNNVEQLVNIFNRIKEPMIKRRQQVENMTWNNFAKNVVMFIKYIEGKK